MLQNIQTTMQTILNDERLNSDRLEIFKTLSYINPRCVITFASSGEEVMAYSGKVGYLSRSQMSSNCSTTGSSSSRGSTGSRGLRKHNEVEYGFAKDFLIPLPEVFLTKIVFNN